MRRTLYFSIIAILAARTHLQAQTLTFTGNTPLIGGTFWMHSTVFTAPGAAGTGVVWDFTTLGTDSMVNYMVIDPTTSAHASLFPTATYAVTNTELDTLFYEPTSEGLDLVGEDVTFVVFDVQAAYSDPVLSLELPCSMGTTWLDDLGATYDPGVGTTTRTGTMFGEADATGTVQLPYGDIGGLLRVHTRLQQLDDAGVSDATRKRDEWAWYTEWSKFPVLRTWADTITVSFPAVTQITTSTEWMDSASVGIQDKQIDAFGLELMPNPAATHVVLTYGAFARTDMTLAISDPMGRCVMWESLGDPATGFHRHEIDITLLPAGLYTVRLMDAMGAGSVRRLIVER